MAEACEEMTEEQKRAMEAEKAKENKTEQTLDLKGDVRFEGDGVYRYESSAQDTPIRIDRTKNMMYGVRAMQAKPVRKEYFYSLEAQKAVHKRYEQMPMGLNHDYKQGPPTIERTVGKVVNSYTDDNGTLFDIQYNPAHERMEQILVDAETGLNTISVSCICNRCEQHGNVVTSFQPAGADFVVNAGQTSKLFEQQSIPAEDKRFESLQKEFEVLKGKLARLEQVQPAQVAATVTQMEQNFTARGVDLSTFFEGCLTPK